MSSEREPEPLRVAKVIGKATFGGVDTMVMNYYRHINRAKVQFDFFIDGLGKTQIEDEILSLGGRVYKLTPYDEDMSANLRQFREILKQNNYKIVHCHMNTLSVFWLREAKRADTPIRIVSNHSTAHWSEGARTVMKYALRPFSRLYATHYMACGEHAGRWIFGNRFFDTGKVWIIRDSVATEQFKYCRETRDRLRDELGLHDKLVVGHVGRFAHQKNHRFLINVFLQIYKQNPDTVLMLVGDGELKPGIERQTADMGLEKSVMFLGVRKDVNELYQAMDVFVLPSYYEGFPIVLVEAQASGLPCVMSDLITHDVSFIDYNIRASLKLKPEEWAKKILQASGGNRENGALKIAEARYDIESAAKALERRYMEIVNDL